MIDKTTYNQYRRELSTAQWRYIFDRTYTSYNSRTKETLIKKGFVLDWKDMKVFGKDEYGCKIYGSEFSKKTHDMVEYLMKLREKKIKQDHGDSTFINNDEELLQIFSECILIDKCPHIYVYRGKQPIIGDIDESYILSPLYFWKIEIDKTVGKFLKHRSMIGYKGSYILEYFP